MAGCSQVQCHLSHLLTLLDCWAPRRWGPSPHLCLLVPAADHLPPALPHARPTHLCQDRCSASWAPLRPWVTDDIGYTLPAGAGVLSSGGLVPQGIVDNVWRHFDFTTGKLLLVCSGYWPGMLLKRQCTEPPATKTHLVPHVNSAEDEKPHAGLMAPDLPRGSPCASGPTMHTLTQGPALTDLWFANSWAPILLQFGLFHLHPRPHQDKW